MVNRKIELDSAITAGRKILLVSRRVMDQGGIAWFINRATVRRPLRRGISVDLTGRGR